MRFNIIFTCLLTICLNSFAQQQVKIKYKTDVEPIIKSGYNINNIKKLELYYKQGLGSNGKPTSQTLNVSREQYTTVCKYLGKTYESFAFANAKIPTYDTAIYAIDRSINWYQLIISDLFIKSDTLQKYINNLISLKSKWQKDKQEITTKILVYRDTLSNILYRIADYDSKKATELNNKYQNIQLLDEYERSISESQTILDNLVKQKLAKEDQVKAALEYKQIQMQQAEKEQKQKEFLQLQQQCIQENPCPNCPIEVAKSFRDAYYAGDVTKIKTLIVDYFGNQTLFYNNDMNLYRDLTAEETKKISQQFKVRTADFKRTNPENIVYYSDNEKRTFFIDKYYKKQLLHATVFKGINDYDKIDLVKWKGEWKVYRVGGAYAGRTGKTIVTGKFFLDPKLLKSDE